MESNSDTKVPTPNEICPLCMETLDETDQAFYPCPCGYQICLWCLDKVRQTMEGKCPVCRQEYVERNFRYVKLSENGLNTDHNYKSNKKIDNRSNSMSIEHLKNMRVLRRNLTYILGIPKSLAKPEILRKLQYFGRYGVITNLVVSNIQINAANGGLSDSYSAYVTYANESDASDAIRDVDSFVIDSCTLKAYYGTVKYCAMFLKNSKCTKKNCLYLHSLAPECDSFPRKNILSNNFRNGRMKPSALNPAELKKPPNTLYRLQLSLGNTGKSFFGNPIDPSLIQHLRKKTPIAVSRDKQQVLSKVAIVKDIIKQSEKQKIPTVNDESKGINKSYKECDSSSFKSPVDLSEEKEPLSDEDNSFFSILAAGKESSINIEPDDYENIQPFESSVNEGCCVKTKDALSYNENENSPEILDCMTYFNTDEILTPPESKSELVEDIKHLQSLKDGLPPSNKSKPLHENLNSNCHMPSSDNSALNSDNSSLITKLIEGVRKLKMELYHEIDLKVQNLYQLEKYNQANQIQNAREQIIYTILKNRVQELLLSIFPNEQKVINKIAQQIICSISTETYKYDTVMYKNAYSHSLLNTPKDAYSSNPHGNENNIYSMQDNAHNGLLNSKFTDCMPKMPFNFNHINKLAYNSNRNSELSKYEYNYDLNNNDFSLLFPHLKLQSNVKNDNSFLVSKDMSFPYTYSDEDYDNNNSFINNYPSTNYNLNNAVVFDNMKQSSLLNDDSFNDCQNMKSIQNKSVPFYDRISPLSPSYLENDLSKNNFLANTKENCRTHMNMRTIDQQQQSYMVNKHTSITGKSSKPYNQNSIPKSSLYIPANNYSKPTCGEPKMSNVYKDFQLLQHILPNANIVFKCTSMNQTSYQNNN